MDWLGKFFVAHLHYSPITFRTSEYKLRMSAFETETIWIRSPVNISWKWHKTIYYEKEHLLNILSVSFVCILFNLMRLYGKKKMRKSNENLLKS